MNWRTANNNRRRADRRVHTSFDVCWHGEDPTYSVKLATHKDLLKFYDRAGLCDIGGGPAGLYFHHVFLTPDLDGPCVFVWGSKETPNTFHCEYHTHTEWVSSKDLEAVNSETSN